VTVLCWFRRHQRTFLPRVLEAMCVRALHSAALYNVAERLRDTARQVAVCRARLLPAQRDPLTKIVRDRDGEALGDALWPYLPCEAGTPLMACNRALREWGLRFCRRMRLQLLLYDTSEAKRMCEFGAHRIERDGTLTMQKHRQIKIRLLLQHNFMTHVSLLDAAAAAAAAQSGETVESCTFAHPTHGTAIDKDRSTTRARLVFDDEARTVVPGFGKPSLRRWDSSEACLVGPCAYAHFPKGKLPTIIVSPNRLSSDFATNAREETKFRIMVEVSLVHMNAPAELGVGDVVTYIQETEQFRILARLESCEAAKKSKKRQVAHAREHALHAQLVRNQHATSPDSRNFDTLGEIVDAL